MRKTSAEIRARNEPSERIRKEVNPFVGGGVSINEAWQSAITAQIVYLGRAYREWVASFSQL